MSRLIDADALKEHIDKLPALPDGNFAGNHSALKALINMQPTIEPELNCSEFPNNWIPCSERLPEKDKEVLFTDYRSDVIIGHLTEFYGLYWEDWGKEYTWPCVQVYAWMPLPEPYKGGVKI